MADVGPVVHLNPSATALYSQHLSLSSCLPLPHPSFTLPLITQGDGDKRQSGLGMAVGAAEGKGSLFGAILAFLFSLPLQQECGLCSTAWSPQGDLADSADHWLGPRGTLSRRCFQH